MRFVKDPRPIFPARRMEIAAISLGRTVEVVHPDLESALRRIPATGFAARCSAQPTCLANRSNRRWPWAKTKKIKTFKNTDHFGGEMKCFSDCILKGTDPEPDGEVGGVRRRTGS